MDGLITLDPQIHRNIKIDTNKKELHGKNLHMMPVVISEFTNVAVQSPIVLTKNGDTGQFVCVALLGFNEKENLLWQNNTWQGIYLPLQIQRQPFFIGSADNSDYLICFDPNSPTITTEGEHLFTEAGEDSDYFIQVKACLGQLLQGEVDNNKLIDLLQELELLQPLSLDITFENDQSTRLNGLYTIDQNKLAALSSDHITKLHQKSLLQPIYTMIASLGQIYALIDKKNKKNAHSV